jgi:quinol monooxygenase YgiN
MIDIVCTQRIKPGMEARAEKALREAERLTLANDKGCERYEWYRSEEPSTFILIERWTDRESAQAHLRSAHMAEILKELDEIGREKFTINRLARLA